MNTAFKKIVGFREDLDLQKRWWHRLLKVVFIFFLVILFPLSYWSWMDEIDDNTINNTVTWSLNGYAKTSVADNSIPEFLALDGSLGCVEGKNLTRVSEYTLSTEGGVCNSDIVRNISKVADLVALQADIGNLSMSDVRNTLLDKYYAALPGDQTYCLINNSLNCDPKHIVKYQKNLLFYIQTGIYSLIGVAIVGFLLQILYYRGLIYVIFGSSQLKNSKLE